MKDLTIRDACMWGGGFLAGSLIATLACLVCGWLDNREGK